MELLPQGGWGSTGRGTGPKEGDSTQWLCIYIYIHTYTQGDEDQRAHPRPHYLGIPLCVGSSLHYLSCPVTWGNKRLTFGIKRGLYYPKKVKGYLLYY